MGTISIILALLSGVALFLFGMSLMGDGLKRVAGNKLELVLYKLTSSPIKGLLLGTVVTAIIQSSSATTVMVVGFVNSGMMKVSQAIGIIMGANIGTSVTGWILCMSYIDGSSGIAQILSTATISALVAIIGTVLKMVGKRSVHKNIGDIMLGFAILMTGMQMMSSAVSPLRTNQTFLNMFTAFENPIMGILVGVVMTAILQSASASIGILEALSVTGGLTFGAAFPMVLGIGVGAAAPVLLSSIGTNKNGKRTALVYLNNDLCGMVIWSTVFYTLNAIFHFGFLGHVMAPVTIALLNSAVRVINICVLLPFNKVIEKVVFLLVKDSDEDKEDTADFDLLEERFLKYPDLAIAQSHTAMNGMAKKARKNIFRAMHLLEDFQEDKFTKVQEKENVIDKYEDKLGTYLMQLTGHEMSMTQTKQASKFLHTISDFERLGDHAVNIAKTALEVNEKKIIFSEEASQELTVLENAVCEIVDVTVNAFCKDNLEEASKVEPLRELIGIVCNEMKAHHVRRLQEGTCDIKQGFAFNDLLTNYERIAAHCSNVAVAMIELEAAEFDTHEYLRSVRHMRNANYTKTFESYAQQFDIRTSAEALKTDLEKKIDEPDSAEDNEDHTGLGAGEIADLRDRGVDVPGAAMDVRELEDSEPAEDSELVEDSEPVEKTEETKGKKDKKEPKNSKSKKKKKK